MTYGFIVILIIAILLCFIIVKFAEYIEKDKEINVVKGYRNNNIYPLLKYAQKNDAFRSVYDLGATPEEIFDITLLINVLKADIPDKYKTIEQKKAYLIATNYNDLNDKHEYQGSGRTIFGRNYAAVPDEVLKEILNNDELITRFAAKYYNEDREEVGRYNCIWHLTYDKNPLAQQIIEKAQKIWDEHHEKKRGIK